MTKREQLARALLACEPQGTVWTKQEADTRVVTILAELREYPPDGTWEVFQKHAKHSGNDYALWEGDAGNFAAVWQAMIDAIE